MSVEFHAPGLSQVTRGMRWLVVRVFHLDRGYDNWMARGMQWLGIGLPVLWGAFVLRHFFAFGELGTLILGLVVMVLWIPLWRALFGLVSSWNDWR